MNDKEEIFLKNRIRELADTCYSRDIPVHTSFLNLYEQTVFHLTAPSLAPVRYVLTGGYEGAERRIVCFLPSYETEESPLEFIRIEPANPKFAEDLSHRDYLGALMNLGLERHTMGDICIEGGRAHLIALKSVADTVKDSLEFVRHTKVRVRFEEAKELADLKRTEEKDINIASSRLDAAVSAVFKLSRSTANEYFDAEKVFVNGRISTNRSYMIKNGDLISVRGLGRFIFKGEKHTTRKGRLMAAVELYI